MLAFLVPLVAFGSCGLSSTGEGAWDSSLDLLLYGPNPVFGSVGLAAIGMGAVASGQGVAFGLIAVGLPIWTATVVSLLLWQLLTPADAARSTPPSSRP